MPAEKAHGHPPPPPSPPPDDGSGTHKVVKLKMALGVLLNDSRSRSLEKKHDVGVRSGRVGCSLSNYNGFQEDVSIK